MAVLNVTEKNIKDEVLNADKLVMIDFFAEWCSPCKMLAPVVKELSDELSDVLVCSVNTEEETVLAKKYEIMTIPTLLFMKNGDVLEKSIGYRPKKDIMDKIQKYL